MIRIDEIYNTIFTPWFEQNRPGTRVFYCSPFGHTDPEHLFNANSHAGTDKDYVYLHDQEPVDVDLYRPLFDRVKQRNLDIGGYFDLDNKWRQERPNPVGHCVVSERGERVEQLEREYHFRTHYYFYHGWAALDWYRGYDKTYLIKRARARRPKTTFISPNRIVGGQRDHRVLFLYNIFKNGLETNYISAPRTCPHEQIDIKTIASKYCNIYEDIEQVFETAELPRLFPGEATPKMSSYELDNFAPAEDSLIYVPTETVYFGNRTHLTEKTFKAIALEMPFVLIAPHHSLEYLRGYGFRTFDPFIDETYDTIEDPYKRIEAATQILLDLQARSAAAKQEFWNNILPIVEHNYRHFYQGGFGDRLWAELNTMLRGFSD